MFEQLDDPSAPDFDGSFRVAVDALVDARRRRIRAASVVGGLAPIVLGSVVLTRQSGGDASDLVESASTQLQPVTTLPAPVSTAVGTDITVESTSTSVGASSPVLAGSPLGDRDETLRDDEWLLPADLPDGFVHFGGSIQYATPETVGATPRESFALSRSYGVGIPGLTEQRGMRLDIEIMALPVSRPVVDASSGWIFDGRQATRSVGATTVFVSALWGDMSDREFRAAVDSLMVVDRSALTATILDPLGPDTVTLVETDFDGERFLLATQRREPSGDDCFFFGRVPTSGYSCIDPLAVDGVMSAAHNHDAGLVEGTSSITIQAFGLVNDDVASVDVELIGDNVVTVEPGDATAGYPHRAWILATAVEIDISVNPLTLGPAVVSVTAHDAEGGVLASDVCC